jgi:hypothetical protein
MFVLPTEAPVRIPDVEPIVATEGVPLVHRPPVILLDNVEEPPTQLVNVPDIVPALSVCTVTIFVAKQPPETTYEIRDVPAETPVTVPVDDPIVAMPVDTDVQVPPEVAFTSVVEFPTQTEAVPVIAGTEVPL